MKLDSETKDLPICRSTRTPGCWQPKCSKSVTKGLSGLRVLYRWYIPVVKVFSSQYSNQALFWTNQITAFEIAMLYTM